MKGLGWVPRPYCCCAVVCGLAVLLGAGPITPGQSVPPDPNKTLRMTCHAEPAYASAGDVVLLHADVAGYSAAQAANQLQFQWTGGAVHPAGAAQAMLMAAAPGKKLVHGKVFLKADPSRTGSCDLTVTIYPLEPQTASKSRGGGSEKTAPTAVVVAPPPGPPPPPTAMPAGPPPPVRHRPKPVVVATPGQRPEQQSLPPFPWPPPVASDRVQIPMALGKAGLKTLGDVDGRILNALSTGGYVQRAHYYVPGGYAIITRVEQIDKTGKAVAEPNRFADGLPPPNSLSTYYQSLFTAARGYYRVIVFVVTNVPFNDTSAPMKREKAEELLTGPAVLPAEMAAEPLPPNSTVTALVYEYQKVGVDAAAPAQPIHSTVSAQTHLQQAGLWGALQTP